MWSSPIIKLTSLVQPKVRRFQPWRGWLTNLTIKSRELTQFSKFWSQKNFQDQLVLVANKMWTKKRKIGEKYFCQIFQFGQNLNLVLKSCHNASGQLLMLAQLSWKSNKSYPIRASRPSRGHVYTLWLYCGSGEKWPLLGPPGVSGHQLEGKLSTSERCKESRKVPIARSIC